MKKLTSPSEITPEETVARQSGRLKKQLLLLVGCVLLAAALILGVFFLVRYLLREEEPSFRFYPVTDENIFENKAYLQMERDLYFTDSNGVTNRIDEVYLEAYPEQELQFIYDYVQAIIHGDVTTFNSLFNENYYKDAEPHAGFTQQMLKDIDLTLYSIEHLSDGDRLVTYRLEYDIYRNNGTYRNDCAPEKESPEFLVLRVTRSGEISIERRVFYREKK